MAEVGIPLVVCADIGSVNAGNFGWWSSAGESGTTPTGLADYVASELARSTRVALGFECPLFVPLVEDEARLTGARPGEGSRAWSAGAGCGALTTGLVQVAWVLRAIRRQLVQAPRAFLAWPEFAGTASGLFLWEAFVSAGAKRGSHIADAQAGGQAFMRALPNPVTANAVVCESSVYSLVGAAMLRTGWSSDLGILDQPCLVLRGGSDGAGQHSRDLDLAPE
jgi:hypothetical protein